MLTFEQFAKQRPKNFGMLKEEKERSDPRQTLRNLLALAQRPGTVAEGEAAMLQAQNIAAKYGIDLDTFDKNPLPKIKPPAPPADPYQTVLYRFGWRRERNPYHRQNAILYVHPSSFDLRGHMIEVSPEGWKHIVYGNPQFNGTTPSELMRHLQFNC